MSNFTLTLPKAEPGMVFHIYRSNGKEEYIKIDTLTAQAIDTEEIQWIADHANNDFTDALHYMSRCFDEGSITAPTIGCQHQWLTYDSGWTKYEYCKHCEEKKA